MKKIFSFIVLLTILASCSKEAVIDTNLQEEVAKKTYEVGLKENNFLNIYGNIVNSTSKVITPNISGKITYLNCEPGTRVLKNTLIAIVEPNYDSMAYQNNAIQANTLNDQIKQFKEMQDIINKTFDTQKNQIELQKQELANSKSNLENNLSEDNGIQKQLQILEESIELLKKNKEESDKQVEDSMTNLRKNIYNTLFKGLKRVDEIFGITDSTSNYSYDKYLGAGNSILKNEVKTKAKNLINISEDDFNKYSNEEILVKLDEYSVFFKDAGNILKESLASVSLPQNAIDGYFTEFMGYSDGFITLKTNFNQALNSKDSTKTTFDMKLKELEAQKSQLTLQESTLKNQQNSLDISEKNIEEQIVSLEEQRKAQLKELDLQILAAEQNLKAIGINFKSENLFAETSGVVKQKIIKADGSQVQIGSQICEIIPDEKSLKLEIYSPERLNIGDRFNFYQNQTQIGTGEIVAEYPEKKAQTQNFIYEGKIDFGDLKQGDYLDIKILREIDNNEIWIDLSLIKPRLDGYYVNIVDENGEVTEQKIEVGNINNGEIRVISGLEKGDILSE